eukprot:CAMPEP_0168352220 /NCGR_PEP_ID=MMETSP0213-20121227/22406_1 /TAXON_ID=151035 /ORGANISM="Euplotes harpa, Strain FSP1.4" /LENGTH=157 /DNA_ID=CAMNT_0008363359 /DNA_START=393 /DNA_END=866 /DNA_ORIENTATION=+
MIHEMPRIHQGDSGISSDDSEEMAGEQMFNRLIELRLERLHRPPQIVLEEPLGNFQRDQLRLENEVQEVRNRLNDIVFRLREIHEEVKGRPAMRLLRDSFGTIRSSVDNEPSFDLNDTHPNLEDANVANNAQGNIFRLPSFESVIAPNLPEFQEDEY